MKALLALIAIATSALSSAQTIPVDFKLSWDRHGLAPYASAPLGKISPFGGLDVAVVTELRGSANGGFTLTKRKWVAKDFYIEGGGRMVFVNGAPTEWGLVVGFVFDITK